MSNKVLPNTVTTEDLLKALETKEEIIKINEDNDILGFFNFYNIKNGNTKVQFKALFKLYNLWSKQPLGKETFYSMLRMYFRTGRMGDYKVAYISVNSLAIGEKTLELLKEKKEDPTKSPARRRHFNNFLEKYHISPGKDLIELEVLLFLYDKWTYEIKRKTKMAYATIIKMFKIDFEIKQPKQNKYWVKIDRLALINVTEESLSRIREGYYAKEKRKKKKQKKH